MDTVTDILHTDVFSRLVFCHGLSLLKPLQLFFADTNPFIFYHNTEFFSLLLNDDPDLSGCFRRQDPVQDRIFHKRLDHGFRHQAVL